MLPANIRMSLAATRQWDWAASRRRPPQVIRSVRQHDRLREVRSQRDSSDASMHQILVYADSLTWGIIPNTRQRLPFSTRWPGVVEAELLKLGHAVRVIEDCLNGRRTAWEDPVKPGRNGRVGIEQRIEVNRRWLWSFLSWGRMTSSRCINTMRRTRPRASRPLSVRSGTLPSNPACRRLTR